MKKLILIISVILLCILCGNVSIQGKEKKKPKITSIEIPKRYGTGYNANDNYAIPIKIQPRKAHKYYFTKKGKCKRKITWKIKNRKIVSIRKKDGKFMLQDKKIGKTTIYVKIGKKKSNKCTVTVYKYEKSIPTDTTDELFIKTIDGVRIDILKEVHELGGDTGNIIIATSKINSFDVVYKETLPDQSKIFTVNISGSVYGVKKNVYDDYYYKDYYTNFTIDQFGIIKPGYPIKPLRPIMQPNTFSGNDLAFTGHGTYTGTFDIRVQPNAVEVDIWHGPQRDSAVDK